MHDLQACEIPLLWRSGSTDWSTSATVHAMAAHGRSARASAVVRLIGRRYPSCTEYSGKASRSASATPNALECRCRRIGIAFVERCAGLSPVSGAFAM